MEPAGLLPFLLGRGRYQLLLVSFLALTLLSALTRSSDLGGHLFEICGFFVLLAGVYATRGSHYHLVLASAFAAICLVSGVMTWITETAPRITSEIYNWGSLGLMLILFDQILRDLFQRTAMKPDDVIGAACGYGVLGLAAQRGLSLVQAYTPYSFAISGEPIERVADDVLHYYSFTVLTTLGFGDITPLTPIAQTLSVLEATTGQLYLTIVVALLVGRRLWHYAPPRESAD